MRDNLKFLYQKAMRSQDLDFMETVFRELAQDMKWDKEADELNYRICMIGDYQPKPEPDEKFRFLVSNSQKGKDWYRSR